MLGRVGLAKALLGPDPPDIAVLLGTEFDTAFAALRLLPSGNGLNCEVGLDCIGVEGTN